MNRITRKVGHKGFHCQVRIAMQKWFMMDLFFNILPYKYINYSWSQKPTKWPKQNQNIAVVSYTIRNGTEVCIYAYV